MIEDFKKQTNETIWEFLHQLTRMTDVSIMDVKNFSPTTSGMPVYIYTTSKETVILCVDWDSASREELADEEGFDGLTHSYYCNDGKSRKSPVWRLMEFTRQALYETFPKGRRILQYHPCGHPTF